MENAAAEEIIEEGIDLEEIAKKYEERGFFRRLGDMFKGLGQPHDTREYKIARIELQRLAAPLVAIVVPLVFGVVLCVVTMISGQKKDVIIADIAQIDDEVEELKEEEEIPPDDIEPPPMEEVEIMVDTPNPGPVSTVTPVAAPPSAQVSVKPAPMDSVAIVKSPVTMKSMTGSRTPGSIGAATRGGAGYGDANTEAAVMKVLWWLKAQQNTDGSWGKNNKVANTALAILTYLAHGEFPGSPSPYRRDFGPTVQQGIDFLIGSLYTGKDNQPHFQGTDGNEYSFLIATYALCEAYGMTKNPNTKTVAMQTLQRIVDNQSPTGGWDYKMAKSSVRDDLSYAGWAMQALKAGKMAGMKPKGLDECIKKAVRCLKKRNFKGGGFNYTAGGHPTGLTATGCLAMQLLGHANEQEVASALDFMREWKPAFKSNNAKGKPNGAKAGGPLPGHNPQYYCYYAAQCKYQAGMCVGATPANLKSWQDWNMAMKQLYPRSIITLPTKIDGPDGKPRSIGYWKMIAEETCGSGGDTMATSLCALQLMVYYRYLPTTSLKAGRVDNAGDDEEEKKKKAREVEVEVDI